MMYSSSASMDHHSLALHLSQADERYRAFLWWSWWRRELFVVAKSGVEDADVATVGDVIGDAVRPAVAEAWERFGGRESQG
ncbi:hypothetical protein E3N88_14914 [Mikania micrantha]|uniref:Uncharacterized protein n=1 Tax=Mikania micrantha TaxID=192012 RepID=A0A5N6P2T1_9ASTR|nr:hypothetical protein E3N88_14914 [Mikania micrantha]